MNEDITDELKPDDVESPPISAFPPDSPTRRPVSIMRRFLESGVDFKWPDNVGECSGTHCVLNDSPIPLEWKRRVSDTNTASIDIYKGGRDYAFQEAFVVKTIRGSNDINSRTRAAKEVENMKDLRHPHVAALLGTYLHSSRLGILIYPAARCDLHQFLKNISKELKPLCGHLPDSPVSMNSDGTDPSPRSRGELPSHDYEEDFPLNLTFAEKVDHLRRYFVCLSQALSYIHESDVRHKDVKPANVLIDSSGSVILTDFGISRRFAKSTSHVTNDKWEWTRKYASPEIMKGKKVPRDDSSDVFSLGCVFLEMATLILEKDHDEFRAFYGRNGDAYYSNLEWVH
jgi:serine/threonine protein kinase